MNDQLQNKKLAFRRMARYSEFAHRIDLAVFYDAIGFVPISHDRGEDRGHCLFPENHKNGDTSGKFAINRDKLVYNCWACGGGDLLSLTMQLYEWDVDEATEWLHQFTHSDLRTNDDFADELLLKLEDQDKKIVKEPMPYFNARVLERFDGPLEYFYRRGISDEVCRKYGLRYSDETIKQAPIKNGEKIDQDYVGPASIWPHYWEGKLVGWQYRWHAFRNYDHRGYALTPKWLAKWTNTTSFPKSSTLFNYDEALKSQDHVIVCESQGTVLFLATYGIPAVAYFGSKPTEHQLKLLRRLRGVILAPDNDSNMTGDKILGTVKYLERFIPVSIAEKVDGPDGADLGDYAYTKDPEAAVRYHLETAVYPAGPVV
jgi:DNA primase